MGVLSVFAQEKEVFIREYGSGYYSLAAYFWSKVIVELPLLILAPVVTLGLAYGMMGFQAGIAKFSITALTLILLNNCGSAIGVFAACLFDSLPMALAIVPLILLPLMIFSGMMVNNASIPVYFNWIKYLSPMKYGFTAIAKNEFTGLRFQKCPFPAADPRCLGESALENWSLLDDFDILYNELFIFAIYIILLILSYFCLYRISKRKTSVLSKK